MAKGFQTGLDRLLTAHRDWLKGKRVGLLAHPASVDTNGVHASDRLHAALGRRLVALFGPEHGFFGGGDAGEKIATTSHPAWGIPVHSLYGDHRRPTEAMLRDLDVLVFDLQDLAVRCYTFVSTLRYVMEECARHGKTLIVCDRPVPFPNTVDGPMLDRAFESFVACVDMPLVYGMTPGEAARFLHRALPTLDLRVARMTGWKRTETRPSFPFVPPSPGIRSWETAWCYPATVWVEALPAIDVGRGGSIPFQVVTAPWLKADTFTASLNALRLPGVRFVPHLGRHPGTRLVVTNPHTFRPVKTGFELVRALGPKAWKGARTDWFDKLAGTDRARRALRAGRLPKFDARSFQRARRAALLY